MRTLTPTLTLCLLTLTLHAKILVFDDVSELKRLLFSGLPSCEHYALIKFSDIQGDLALKGITTSNGVGHSKYYKYLSGVLCNGSKGTKIPGWVDLKGRGKFLEGRTYRKCTNREQYQWEYMISPKNINKCDCKTKGVDKRGHGLYAAVYADQKTGEVTPGYKEFELAGIHLIKNGRQEYQNDNYYIVC